MNFEKIYKLILQVYEAVYTEKDIIKRSDEYNKFDRLLNEFAKNDGTLKIIFDNVKYRIIGVSDNLESLSGFTKNDFENANSLIFFKVLSKDYMMAPLFLAKWYTKVSADMIKMNGGIMQDMQLTMCGLKMSLPNGKKIQTLIRASTLEVSENGYPVLCLVSVFDITHMLKSDHYWGRMTFGELNPNKFYYHSKEKKYNKQDIISDREKEVLKLVAEGKESKDIAQELFISANTVTNHRKNAIERTGTKDSTALIQLCKMLGMF